MLHNINFLDWRTAKRRAVHQLWIGMSVVCFLGLGVIEWHRYQGYQVGLAHAQQQHQQRVFAQDMVSKRYQALQKQELEYEELRQENQKLNTWISESKHPYNVMKLIEAILPSNTYLDRLMVAGNKLAISGLVEHDGNVTQFAKALERRMKTARIDRLKVDAVLQRWQRPFYPFEMNVEFYGILDE
ncbi:PilN domain-containing protein [Vibrio sp. WJH972]